jgi:predicted kinase
MDDKGAEGRSVKYTYLKVMVGLPRSGKTTYCEQHLKPSGWVVVNPDSFRLAIHGHKFISAAEPFVWATVYAAVDGLRMAGHNVVVDGCHLTKKRREPWVQRGAEFMPMGTTKEICIQRAGDDHEIIQVIHRMALDCDWPQAIGESLL